MELEAARNLATTPGTPGTVFELRLDGKTTEDMDDDRHPWHRVEFRVEGVSE